MALGAWNMVHWKETWTWNMGLGHWAWTQSMEESIKQGAQNKDVDDDDDDEDDDTRSQRADNKSKMFTQRQQLEEYARIRIAHGFLVQREVSVSACSPFS